MGQYFPKPKDDKGRTDRDVTNAPTGMTQVVQVITYANNKTGVPVNKKISAKIVQPKTNNIRYYVYRHRFTGHKKKTPPKTQLTQCSLQVEKQVNISRYLTKVMYMCSH